MNGLTAFVLVLALISGLIVGWVSSAQTISHECKTLNGFYVGSSVFTCEVKK